jgi:hypothetical protein
MAAEVISRRSWHVLGGWGKATFWAIIEERMGRCVS